MKDLTMVDLVEATDIVEGYLAIATRVDEIVAKKTYIW